MSALNGLDISASGMSAHRVWLDVTSVNLANSQTTRTADGQAFRRKLVLFQQTDQGVTVAGIVDDQSPFRRVYSPGSPDADSTGYVNYPNVDPSIEMVDLMSASRGYQLNAEAFSSQRDMLQKTLDILR